MGKTITVSTDDFDGMCEPPDTWPQDSSTTPPCGLEAGTQTGPRQKLSAGMGGVVSVGGGPSWGPGSRVGDCAPPGGRRHWGKSPAGRGETQALVLALPCPALLGD